VRGTSITTNRLSNFTKIPYHCLLVETISNTERLRWAAYASIGAGVIHGAAVGLHAEHPTSSLIFMTFTLLQVGWGVVVLSNQQRWVLVGGCVVNAAAVAGWIVTLFAGISFIDGLEIAERPQPADSFCALLAAVSIAAVFFASRNSVVRMEPRFPFNAATLCGVFTFLALLSVAGTVHEHGEFVPLADSDLSISADGVIVSPTTIVRALDVTTSSSAQTTTSMATTTTTIAPKTSRSTTTTTQAVTATPHAHGLTAAQAAARASGWPRTYDPAAPIDFTGIDGVTPEQSARATTLIQATQRDLPKYAQVAVAMADGYTSIGDGGTGFEHFVKWTLLNDGRVLDTAAPESLVYEVRGGVKTLVSAMFMADKGTPINDKTLVEYAGGLMQWHVHTNLCWLTVNGAMRVVGVTDSQGTCRFGFIETDGSPMVHVWITPHKCGPFAALEGVAAGVADASDAERVDLCNKVH
jgi:hypothetical protein